MIPLPSQEINSINCTPSNINDIIQDVRYLINTLYKYLIPPDRNLISPIVFLNYKTHNELINTLHKSYSAFTTHNCSIEGYSNIKLDLGAAVVVFSINDSLKDYQFTFNLELFRSHKEK